MTHLAEAVEFDRSGDHLTVYIGGELDGSSVERIEASIASHIHSTDDVIWLDLEAVTFCGSLGVSMLLRIRNHVDQLGARLTLYQPSPAVRRTLELCELDQYFSIWRPLHTSS
jgi:anti-anti-sigma factor